jgi:5'-deoxynucleotidase YfbR-like HD superfamily hydrolase
VYLIKPESVSDHSTQTGILCLLVGNEVNKRLENAKSKIKVNLEKLALKSIIHDLDESGTCDIPRNVKYYNSTISEEFEKMGHSIVKGLADRFDFPYLYEEWKNAKDKSIEGVILKICDMIHVVRKLVDEVMILGNLNMLQVAIELKDHLKSTKNYINTKVTGIPSVAIDVANELIDFSFETVQYIIKKYQSEITDYNFTSLKSE